MYFLNALIYWFCVMVLALLRLPRQSIYGLVLVITRKHYAKAIVPHYQSSN